MATAKKEAKKVSVEYGPFRKLKARELAKKGGSTAVEKDGMFFVHQGDLSEKDAKAMVKSLEQAGFTAHII